MGHCFADSSATRTHADADADSQWTRAALGMYITNVKCIVYSTLMNARPLAFAL